MDYLNLVSSRIISVVNNFKKIHSLDDSKLENKSYEKRRKVENCKKSEKEKRNRLIQSMISRMQILCKVDYGQEILAEDFQFVVEEESLDKDSRLVHRLHYRGLKYLFDKDMFSDYDQSRNLVGQILEGMCFSKEEKLNACKKKLDMKKKNEQMTRKVSDFFGPSKEDVDFACMNVTDSDSDDSTSDISNDAIQSL